MPSPSPLHRCVRLLLGLAVALPFSLQAQGVVATSTTLTVSPAAPTTAQTLTLTATVTPLAAATGSEGVQFTLGTGPQPPQTVGFAYPNPTTGVASVTIGPLAAGSYTYQANFLGVSSPQPNGPYYYPSSSSPVTVSVTQAGGPNGPALKGQYAFLFQGLTNQQVGNRLGTAGVGSFTADGNGSITSGVLDLNLPAKPSLDLPVTGTYTLANNGRGTITINSSLGTQVFEISVSGHVSTVETASGTASGGALFGTVQIARQTPTDFGDLSIFNLNLAGETSGASPYSLVTGSGQLFAAGEPSIVLDQTVGFSVATSLNYQGAHAIVPSSTTGRFALPFTAVSGSTVPQTINLVGYEIDSNHVFLMSTDPHQTSELLSGTAVQ